MVDSKPYDTPVAKAARISFHDGTRLENASEYMKIIDNKNSSNGRNKRLKNEEKN